LNDDSSAADPRNRIRGLTLPAKARGACMLSSTIRNFSSSDQRRRRPDSMTSKRSTWILRLDADGYRLGRLISRSRHYRVKKPGPHASRPI
jgi:hypothetical protein